jgi:hypothetical protein
MSRRSRGPQLAFAICFLESVLIVNPNLEKESIFPVEITNVNRPRKETPDA